MKKIINKLDNLSSKWSILLSFFFLVIIVGYVEEIHQKDFSYFFTWITNKPTLFLFSVFIVTLLAMIFMGLFGKIYAGFLGASAVLMFFGFLSVKKKDFLEEPLFPWDFYQLRNALGIAGHLNLQWSFWEVLKNILFLGTLFLGAYLLIRLTKKIKIHWLVRTVLVLVPVFTLWAFGFQEKVRGQVNTQIGVRDIVWDQRTNYALNGFIVGFFINLKYISIDSPEGYSQLAIAEIVNEKKVIHPNEEDETHERPNILVLMNEAFWDPKYLPNVSFSQDPTPTISNLERGGFVQRFISPTIGGKTANVEFEVLTGFSTKFLPTGSVPYNQHIHGPIPSFVRLLKEQDYQTVAIHPYHKWFYSRESVYPFMGFDRFLSIDDFDGALQRGDFISDTALSERIINEYEAKSKEQPLFLFAVTMQNHGPYDKIRYEEAPDVVVTSEVLSEKNLSILQTYTQGIYEADNSLNHLINHFQKETEPVVVVFFGDHLPMLGYSFATYVESGFIATSNEAEWSFEEKRKMHEIPIVIWANYPIQNEEKRVIGASYVAQYLINTLGLQSNGYFNILAQSSVEIGANIHGLTLDANGNAYEEMPNALKLSESFNWLMQYDLMFGKSYLLSTELLNALKDKETKR